MLVSVSSPVSERFYDRPANHNVGATSAGDLWDLVEAVRVCADFSEDFDRMDASLTRFTQGERGMFAALVYLSAVEEDGHDAYFASAGAMQYEDALEFFMSAGMPEVASLLEQASHYHMNAPIMAMGMGAAYDPLEMLDFDLALATLTPVDGLRRYARRYPDAFSDW